jgi:hypothetical protein
MSQLVTCQSASSRDLRTPDLLRHAPVDSGQEIRELSNADRHNAFRHRRPQKAFAVETLRKQACTLPVVPNDFDQITSTASEDVEIAAVGIALQLFLHHQRKAAEAASHVGVPGGEPYPHIAGDRDHRRSSTSRTRASAAASTLASTRTRRPPPRWISIRPLRAPDPARGCPLGAELAASVDASAIRTAAKRGTTGASSWFVRDCRRQVNTKLGEIP